MMPAGPASFYYPAHPNFAFVYIRLLLFPPQKNTNMKIIDLYKTIITKLYILELCVL